MSDLPQCVDCARVNVETHGGRCWSCDRDTARAEGVAAERARVVAAVKKRAWMLPKVERQALLTVAERLERGLHDKEGT